MITLLFVLLQMSSLSIVYTQPKAVDVPAISYVTPASHPCNLPSPASADGSIYAVCITGPETHWKCDDESRVMLTAENGLKHCISFAAIEDKNR